MIRDITRTLDVDTNKISYRYHVAHFAIPARIAALVARSYVTYFGYTVPPSGKQTNIAVRAKTLMRGALKK